MTGPDLSIKATRAELVTDLTSGGFTPLDYVSSAVEPPVVIIGCGDPYLLPGDEFRPAAVVMRVDLFIVFAAAQGQSFTDAANRTVQNVLLAIDDRWGKSWSVSAPFKATNLGGRPTVRLSISTTALITESD